MEHLDTPQHPTQLPIITSLQTTWHTTNQMSTITTQHHGDIDGEGKTL